MTHPLHCPRIYGHLAHAACHEFILSCMDGGILAVCRRYCLRGRMLVGTCPAWLRKGQPDSFTAFMDDMLDNLARAYNIPRRYLCARIPGEIDLAACDPIIEAAPELDPFVLLLTQACLQFPASKTHGLRFLASRASSLGLPPDPHALAAKAKERGLSLSRDGKYVVCDQAMHTLIETSKERRI